MLNECCKKSSLCIECGKWLSHPLPIVVLSAAIQLYWKNLFAERKAPSTKIAIYSRPQKSQNRKMLKNALQIITIVSSILCSSSILLPCGSTEIAIFSAALGSVAEIDCDLIDPARRLPERVIKYGKWQLLQAYFVIVVLSAARHI